MRSCPKKPKAPLPALPFFSPYLLHDVIRNVSRWFRQGNCRDPSLQRRRENATGNQALLLFGPVVCTAGNDSRHRLVAVANQHFFAVLYELDVSAELRFQVANVYGTHTHIITNLTMLVMSVLATSFPPRSWAFDPGLLPGDQALHELGPFLLIGLDAFVQEHLTYCVMALCSSAAIR